MIFKHFYEKDRSYLWIYVSYVFLLLPFIISITNTIPSADDFSFAVRLGEFSSDFYPVTVAKFAYSQYLGWSGRWMVCFFPLSLNPLVLMPDTPSIMMRVIMPVFFIAFISAFLFFFVVFYEGISHKKILVLSWVSLATILNIDIYTEIFYWYTGMNYLSLVIAELIVYALIWKYFHKPTNKFELFLLGILGAYACNGLNQIIPVLGLYVFLFVKKICRYKQSLSKLDIIYPVIFIISALINVMAPGNYVRHNVIDNSGLHPILAFEYTIENIIILSFKVLSNPVALICVFVFFIYGVLNYHVNNKEEHVNICEMGLLFFSIIIGMMYPVSLGYSGIETPNRVYFLFVIHFIVGIGIIAYRCGGAFSKQFERIENQDRFNLQEVIIVLLLCVFLSESIVNLPYYITVSNIYRDRIIHAEYMEVLNVIKNSEDMNVEISSNMQDSPILKEIGLTDDPYYWVNEAVASYYGKDSVVVHRNAE